MAGKRKHTDIIWLPANQVWARVPASASVPAVASSKRASSSRHTSGVHLSKATSRQQRSLQPTRQRSGERSMPETHQQCRWDSPVRCNDERDEEITPTEPQKQRRRIEAPRRLSHVRGSIPRRSTSSPPSHDATPSSPTVGRSPTSPSSIRVRPHGFLPAPDASISSKPSEHLAHKYSKAESAAAALRVALSAGEKHDANFDQAGELTTGCLVEDAEEPPEALPSCPICLADISDIREKALLMHCLHVFCVPCLQRWLPVKPLCPLCKADVVGYMYDIQSEGNYKEHHLPPPTREKESYRTPDTELNHIRQMRRGYGWASYQDNTQNSSAWVRERRTAAAADRAERAASAAERAAVAAESAAERARASTVTEPRPYYRRVQQHLQSGAATRIKDSAPELRIVPADAVLTWRRSVYERSLRAVPMAPLPGAAAVAERTVVGRERRLEEWVGRELRALFQNEDVNLVRSFVLGLVSSYGLSTSPATASSSAAAPPTSVRARSAVNGTLQLSATVRSTPSIIGGGSSSSNPCAIRVDAEGDPRITGLRAGPLEALRPFLQEHAEHFWHELRCFTSSPYSMATYDRLVQYTRAEHLALPISELPQAPPPEATRLEQQPLQQSSAIPPAQIPAGNRPSRWDVHAPVPQQQSGQVPTEGRILAAEPSIDASAPTRRQARRERRDRRSSIEQTPGDERHREGRRERSTAELPRSRSGRQTRRSGSNSDALRRSGNRDHRSSDDLRSSSRSPSPVRRRRRIRRHRQEFHILSRSLSPVIDQRLPVEGVGLRGDAGSLEREVSPARNDRSFRNRMDPSGNGDIRQSRRNQSTLIGVPGGHSGRPYSKYEECDRLIAKLSRRSPSPVLDTSAGQERESRRSAGIAVSELQHLRKCALAKVPVSSLRRRVAGSDVDVDEEEDRWIMNGQP